MTLILGLALGGGALLAILWWPVLRDLHDLLVRSRFPSTLGPNYEWVALYIEANEDDDHASFCSWACLAAVATQRAMDRELPSAADWTEPPSAATSGSSEAQS